MAIKHTMNGINLDVAVFVSLFSVMVILLRPMDVLLLIKLVE